MNASVTPLPCPEHPAQAMDTVVSDLTQVAYDMINRLHRVGVGLKDQEAIGTARRTLADAAALSTTLYHRIDEDQKELACYRELVNQLEGKVLELQCRLDIASAVVEGATDLRDILHEWVHEQRRDGGRVRHAVDVITGALGDLSTMLSKRTGHRRQARAEWVATLTAEARDLRTINETLSQDLDDAHQEMDDMASDLSRGCLLVAALLSRLHTRRDLPRMERCLRPSVDELALMEEGVIAAATAYLGRHNDLEATA